MELDGILNAWITKVRIKRARIRAIIIASTVSLRAFLFFIDYFLSYHHGNAGQAPYQPHIQTVVEGFSLRRESMA